MNLIPAQPAGQLWFSPRRGGLLEQQLICDGGRPKRLEYPRQKQEHLILESFERKMAELVTEKEVILAHLKRYFVFPGDSSVSDFLFDHRMLSPLLLESVPALRRIFGLETVFQLKAPLDSFGSQTLYAVAIWPGTAAEAGLALDRLDEEWWLARSFRAAGDLTFTYELV